MYVSFKYVCIYFYPFVTAFGRVFRLFRAAFQSQAMELEAESSDAMELEPESSQECDFLDLGCEHWDSKSGSEDDLDLASDGPASRSSSEADLVLEASGNPAESAIHSPTGSAAGLHLELDAEAPPAVAANGRTPRFGHCHGAAVRLSKAEVCFRWAFCLVAVLEKICGTRVLRERLEGSQRFSSHFSGLGGAEVAVNFIQSAVLHLLWLRLSWTQEHACDKGRSQQRVLKARLQKLSCCIFADIFDRVPDLRHFAVGHESDAVFADMKATALAAQVSQSGKCVTHGGPCKAVHTDIDMSGSPCQSWTGIGKLLRHNSPQVAVTLAWCAWLRAALVKLAIHENVLGFDVEILKELLGDLYDIFPLTGVKFLM